MSDNIVPFQSGSDGKWWSVSLSGERRADVHLRGTIGVSKVYNDFGADAAGTAREFESDLRALGEVDAITLYVASLGGYVWDALMIHDVIARHPARVTAVVDGIAASAASFVILAADEITMPANAYLMIHNAHGVAMGDHRTMLEMGTRLEQWSNDIAKMYARKMGTTDDAGMKEIRALMDAETWLTGEEAQAMGLVDTLTGSVEIAASLIPITDLPGLARDRMPEAVRAAFDKAAMPMQNPTNSADAAPVADPIPAVDPVAEPVETEPEIPGADIAAMVTAAVTALLAPISERLEKIEARGAITASGAKPWPNPQPAENVISGIFDRSLPRAKFEELNLRDRSEWLKSGGKVS